MRPTHDANLLLAQLPQPLTADILMSADIVTLAAGQLVHVDDGPGTGFVYFPYCGVISVRSSQPSGEQVEIAGVGREGGFGLVSLLGVPLLAMIAEITLDVRAARVPLSRFRELMQQWPEARPVVLQFLGGLFREVVRSFGCFRFHTHDQWVARWILTTADKAGDETLRITHDVIARRLGSQRHGVSATLAQMRAVGAIATDRRYISIVDRPRLQALACSCYVPPDPSRCHAAHERSDREGSSGPA
jgi:CRP-like cAMP-binding protein